MAERRSQGSQPRVWKSATTRKKPILVSDKPFTIDVKGMWTQCNVPNSVYGGFKRLVAHRPRLVYYVVYYPLAANYINSYWKIAEKFKDKYEVFGGLV